MLQTASGSRSETHGKFIWCELMTPDTDAAGKFYSSVVGWKVKDASMPGMSYFLFEMGEGDNCPGIGGMMNFPPELEGKIPPNWTGYVAIDDVDRTAKDFAENGGRVQREPEDIPGIGRFAVVADPHGAVICIMTPLPMESPPQELAPEAVGNVGWRELYAGNGQEAFDFYSKMFGWTLDHDFDMGPMGVYKIFSHNGRPVGGMMTKPADMPMACWSYYFNVEAIDVAIGRVTAGGGKIVNGPMEVPGGSWIVNCVDPQGAYFSLVAPKR
ncbi:putative enzyme related to lactoylglutathione lyase [Rhizobium petrolearium]|uniref:VOC family protein n=1 Tax=Neorhizobium petrolearium TaxID=515361 RepID=UPI001AE39420|nr:VOC family protein [Neorhizobium petrolearium]MBP1842538.1 putative enzyme related to lactoylglutathione lyase [Neorhizobium petrolearium]